MSTLDDPGRFLADLEAKMTALVDDSEREGKQATDVGQTLEQISARANSTDRAITVIVDSGGSPTDLRLTDRASMRTPAQLAAEIMSCIRTAQANLADALREQSGDNPFAERLAKGYESRYPRPEPHRPPPAPRPQPPAANATFDDDENFGEQSVLIPADSTKGDR